MELLFEKAAQKGEPMPKGLNASEQLAFLSLRNLYYRYYAKQISVEDAKAEKREIVAALSKNQHHEELMKKTSALWFRIDQAAVNYAKEPTIENAEVFYATVYGLPQSWREAKK